MKRHLNIRRVAILGFVLTLGGVLFAQQAPDRKLLVNGKSTDAVVVDVNGHSYIDIETVAQITNGSVKFEPDQVRISMRTLRKRPQGCQRISRAPQSRRWRK